MGYTPYAIGAVTTNNANGTADSLGVLVELTGVVYGVNFRPAGLQFTIIDDNNDGIGVFSNSEAFGYTVQEGDEVTVRGSIGQFSGLTQVNLDTVILNSSGNNLFAPTDITALNEETESQLVNVTGVTITDVQNAGGLNVTLSNGMLMRIDFDTDIDEAFITGLGGSTLAVTGIGGQFDSSEPYDEGYQLLPRYQADITIINSVDEPTWAADTRLFPNPATDRIAVRTSVTLDKMTLHNAFGQEVMRTSAITNEWHIAHLPAGVYTLTLWSGETFITRKVVKQ
ncbi:MAG: T9SS type A sorting domain-containing protein [Saprospiraceae bacterium]